MSDESRKKSTTDTEEVDRVDVSEMSASELSGDESSDISRDVLTRESISSGTRGSDVPDVGSVEPCKAEGTNQVNEDAATDIPSSAGTEGELPSRSVAGSEFEAASAEVKEVPPVQEDLNGGGDEADSDGIGPRSHYCSDPLLAQIMGINWQWKRDADGRVMTSEDGSASIRVTGDAQVRALERYIKSRRG